jgi:signal transduction histidine kinase
VESCCIKIDEYHFDIMIREIVENAIKYSKPDDVIVIHGSKDKKVYRLTINGIGRGMSNQEIQKAVFFEDYNEKIISRNGLGFNIVKLILKLFNGEIKIRSKENKYTRVEITLPLAVSASDSNDFEKKIINSTCK